MIYLVSGKRASGKDTFCSIFSSCFENENVKIVALADAPKRVFCKKMNIDLFKFMSERDFKDRYRKQFIDFAENAKLLDEFVWCREAMKDCEHCDNIIVSDLRYPVELSFFQKFFGRRFVTIRIEAIEAVREQRGWKFISDVDNHLSETGMDGNKFDYVIKNDRNDNGAHIIKQIKDLKIV